MVRPNITPEVTSHFPTQSDAQVLPESVSVSNKTFRHAGYLGGLVNLFFAIGEVLSSQIGAPWFSGHLRLLHFQISVPFACACKHILVKGHTRGIYLHTEGGPEFAPGCGMLTS